MNPQICDCGACLTCRSRDRGRKWRESHAMSPEQRRDRRLASAREWWNRNRKGIPRRSQSGAGRWATTESDVRLDAIAEAVWARLEAPWYYGSAAERYASRVAPRVNINRVVML